MKLLKWFVVAATTVAISGPAFAGRDQSQIMEQERAVKKTRAEGLAGPTGPQGQVGPTTRDDRKCKNIGHPSERRRCR